MNNIQFAWDEAKNSLNRRKHKVSFEEAKTCFFDDSALLIYDPDHSEDEDKFILLGLSNQAKLLIVCHCYREDKDGFEIIRIYSARKANRQEAMQYKYRREL
ncbi:MAG: BrnT family toxin [bacterium]